MPPKGATGGHSDPWTLQEEAWGYRYMWNTSADGIWGHRGQWPAMKAAFDTAFPHASTTRSQAAISQHFRGWWNNNGQVRWATEHGRVPIPGQAPTTNRVIAQAPTMANTGAADSDGDDDDEEDEDHEDNPVNSDDYKAADRLIAAVKDVSTSSSDNQTSDESSDEDGGKQEDDDDKEIQQPKSKRCKTHK